VGQYNYYISVVPTIYTPISGRKIKSNQVRCVSAPSRPTGSPPTATACSTPTPRRSWRLRPPPAASHTRVRDRPEAGRVRVEAAVSCRRGTGVFFFLNISPLVVRINESQRDFAHFAAELVRTQKCSPRA
jgi:hypothetical protein